MAYNSINSKFPILPEHAAPEPCADMRKCTDDLRLRPGSLMVLGRSSTNIVACAADGAGSPLQSSWQANRSLVTYARRSTFHLSAKNMPEAQPDINGSPIGT